MITPMLFIYITQMLFIYITQMLFIYINNNDIYLHLRIIMGGGASSFHNH